MLPPERARAYLEGCPDLQVVSAFATVEMGRSTLFLVHAESFEPLSRLAQCEALMHLSIEIDVPPTTDGGGSEDAPD